MPRSSAQRRATQNSPSSLASVHPIGPGVPAAVEALERGDQRGGDRVRLAADGGRRVQQPRELDDAVRLGELGADRRREVLDVGDLDDRRLLGRGDPDGVRAQRAGDPVGDDRLLLAVLGRAEQLLAEVVVDRRVGGAADRARERDRGDAQALAAHEQLGRGGDERALAAAGAEDEAGAERGAEDAEHRRGVVCAGRVDGDLARQHDLVERAATDPLDRARDRLDIVLGRGDAGDPEAPGRRGVEQRQRIVAQPRHASGHPLRELLGHVVGRGERRDGQADLAVAARERDLRHDERAGAEAGPVRRRAAVGGEREAADRHEPGAGRPAVLTRDRAARELAPGCGDHGEAVGPARFEPAHRAERGDRGAAARGLLVGEPVLLGRPRGEHDRARVDGRIERAPSGRRAPRRRRGARAAPRARSARPARRGPRIAARTGRVWTCGRSSPSGRDTRPNVNGGWVRAAGAPANGSPMQTSSRPRGVAHPAAAMAGTSTRPDGQLLRGSERPSERTSPYPAAVDVRPAPTRAVRSNHAPMPPQ